MDSLYGRAVALLVPFAAVLVTIEIVLDRVRGTRYYRFGDAIANLGCGMVSTGTRVFFGFLGVLFYNWTLEHFAPFRLDASRWWTWAFAFVLYDFCYYWQHRLGHTVGLFWAAHSVHHQSEEFNLTAALRQPGTSAFSAWMFYLPLALCGVPTPVYLMVGVVQLFYQLWPHTRVIGRLGALDRWVQTPSNHRVHHAQNDIYLDRNYVGVFLLWDRLFGTFQEERDDEPCIYGVRGQLKSWNPIWANLHYYWAMAQDSWRAASWRDKLRVWYAPPGWRPADVAARCPKPPYDPARDFERFDPARSPGVTAYVTAQFVAIFAGHSHFLALLPRQTATANVAYYLFLVASLGVLGGLLENRRMFVWIEAIRLAAVAAFVSFSGGWFGMQGEPARLAMTAATAVSLVWLAALSRGVEPLKTPAASA